MTDCEHLIENALNAIIIAEKNGSDSYEAFCDAMAMPHNVSLLHNVYVTQDELWEIAYYAYLVFTDPNYQKEGENDMYDAYDVARYIITKCTRDGHAINNLQLQKILYILQVRHINKYGCPLFSDNFEAWSFGPVVTDVYYKFCGFGAMEILMEYDDIKVKKRDRRFIDSIVEKNSRLAPWDINRKILDSDGAWAQTYDGGKGNHRIIPIGLLWEENYD